MYSITLCGLRAASLALAALCLTFLAPAVFANEAFAAPKAVPRFESGNCPQLPPQLAEAHCGFLVVPEDHTQPAGTSIRLFVMIVPAQLPHPASDPVVYLGTGPGGIASSEAPSVVDAGVNRDRNLVVMNQRGQYLSDPALTCESIDEFTRPLLALRFYSPATKRAHLAATAVCHEKLMATGAHLALYNSTESAADLADLRTALGIQEWNVFGVSYGTDLAQAYMRDHPEGIRSVILDSVAPITITLPDFWSSTRAGFDNLFAACAAKAACDAAYPHLEATFTRLVNELEAEPLTTTVRDPATGEQVKIVLDGGALIDWLRDQSRANTPGLPVVPDLIQKLADGNPEALQAIALYRVRLAPPPSPGTPAVSYGLGYGVVCREQYPFPPQALFEAGRQAFPLCPVSIQEQAVSTWAYSNDDCRKIWKVPAAPPEFHRPVVSNIPTLLISGSFDAITSLDFAKAVAANLSKATVISIPGIGHFVAPYSECAQTVIASFLSDPNMPDTACVLTATPPRFVPFSAAGESFGEPPPIID
jgi:pimeloyl-ACP methyl ester carboxylesterase